MNELRMRASKQEGKRGRIQRREGGKKKQKKRKQLKIIAALPTGQVFRKKCKQGDSHLNANR